MKLRGHSVWILSLMLWSCGFLDDPVDLSGQDKEWREYENRADSRETNLVALLKEDVHSSVWASLVELSYWDDSIAGKRYTLLVPSDAALRAVGLDDVKELVPARNRELLNRCVGRHLFKGIIPVPLPNDTTLVNVLGESLHFNSVTQELDGIKLANKGETVRAGSLIHLSGVLKWERTKAQLLYE